MDLVVLFRAFVKRKWILIFVPLLAGITAFVFTQNIEKEYTSRAQLATGFTIKGVADQDFDLMKADVQFSNLIETLGSTQVLGITGYQLLMHDLTSPLPFRRFDELSEGTQKTFNQRDVNAALSILKSKIESIQLLNPNIPAERQIMKALLFYGYDHESMSELLNISRSARTDYVNVLSVTENSELSAYIVNSVCKNFFRYNRFLQNNRSAGSLDTLRKQVEESRRILMEKQGKLTEFKTVAGVLDLTTSGNSKVDLANGFEGRLIEERRDLRLNRSELQEVQGRLNDIASPTRGASSEILKIRQQINELETEYQKSKDAAILRKLTDLRQRRDDLAEENDIEGLRDDRELSKELLARASDLRAKINAGESNIRLYISKIAALNANVSSYAGKEAEIKPLEQEVELATDEYVAMNEKYNAAVGLTTSFRSNDITQTLTGQPAIEPESSKRPIIVGLAAIATFLVCAFIILLLEYFDLSIKTPANFLKLTNIKILGSLPIALPGKDSNSFFYDDSGNENKLLSDMVNKLRYELESTGNRVFLFTSTKEQEGKTIVLALLAKLYAKTRKNILIIDSNFSNNEITKKFNLNPKSSHQFFLDEHRHPDVSTSDRLAQKEGPIVRTEHKNIDIIGCKEDYSLPSEIFPDHDPLNKFKELTERYDYIFIEGPSLNNHSDSKELAKYVDGVVLVTSMQNQIKHQDKQSLAFLKNLNDKFIGAILNKVDARDL